MSGTRVVFPGAEAFVPEARKLNILQDAVQKCQGCDLYEHATQAVFGEGPASARIVFVGEQPGNEEDKQGRPFVGPAGLMLDRALKDAGIQRADVYVTNAVKHFRFEERGKRRIHKKPSAAQVDACEAWLEAEVQLLRPDIVVCLGATAAQALLGSKFRLTKERGKPLPHSWAQHGVATVHPSAILRIPDEQGRHEEYSRLVCPRSRRRSAVCSRDGWKPGCIWHRLLTKKSGILKRSPAFRSCFMSQLVRRFASIIGSLIAISSAYAQPIPAPAPVFSKVFGGSSGWDFADNVAVDSQGNVVVVGTTKSPDFPLTNAIQPRITQPPLIVNSGSGVSAFPQLRPGTVDVTAVTESVDGSAVYAASSSGIFRSLDGGATWSQQLPGLAGANTLAVDAGSADILYAGVPEVLGISGAGFFKSVDGGQHWSAVNLAAVSNSAGVFSLATAPLAPGTVYAQVKALYRSRDDGTTWTALAPNGYFIYTFGLAPSEPNIVYAVASDGLLYRSADGGDTRSASGAKFGNAYPNAIVASAVGVDPLNPNTVWIVAKRQSL